MTTITIGGREFRIGATYLPRSGKSPSRTLVAYRPRNVEVVWQWARSHRRVCCVDTWLRWAGEEVTP